MKKILAIALLLLSSKLFSQITVTIHCNIAGSFGNFSSGAANALGVKLPGSLSNLNNVSGNRGWAAFDITTIPVGVNIISASLRFTTFDAVSSDSYNDLYGFLGNPSVTNGVALYTQCATGNSFNNSTWLANIENIKPFNAAGLAFLAANTGSSVNIGFVRSGANNYSIYGSEAMPDSQPQLTVSYALILCTGVLPGGITNSNITTICNAAIPFTLSVSGSVAANTGGISYQWQSSADSVTWNNITGANDSGLIRAQSTTTWYRRRTGCGSNYSYSVPKKIYTNELSNGGIISGSRFSCSNGQPVKLYITGIGNIANLTFQWEQSSTGIVFADIPGATQDTLNTTIASETYLRRKTFCGSNAFYSNTRRIQPGSSPIVPVYKDFTGEGNGCFTQDNNNRWTVSPANAIISGRTNGWPVNQRIWLFSPGILLTAQKTYRVRYYRYMKGTDTEACSIFLYAGRAPQADSMTHWMLAEWSDANWPPSGSLIGYIYADFTPTTTDTYYFGWGYSADGPTTVTINDLSVKLSPSCAPPANLTISNLTPTSATFNWQTNIDSGNDTVVNYKWRIDRTAPPFSDSGFVTGNQITLSNLTPETGYTFKILSNCGEPSIPPYSNSTTISLRTPGQNDDCPGAIDILQTTYSGSCTGRSVSTFYGSPSGNPPPCNTADFDDDLWYKFTATHNSAILKLRNYVTTSGSSSGLVYAVYEDSCNGTTTLDCNFIGIANGTGETVIQGLTEGKTYYLRLASIGLGAIVNFNFCVMGPDPKIPIITGVDNTTYCAGTPVYLSGNYFEGATSVKLGALPADSFKVFSPVSIGAYFNKAYQGLLNVTTPLGVGTYNGSLITIKSNAVLPITGPIYIGDSDNIVISSDIGIKDIYLVNDYYQKIMDEKKFQWDFKGKTKAGGNEIGSAPNQLSGPFGVTKDIAGNMYVADAGNHRIQKIVPGSVNAITIAGGNGSGSAPDQLNNPRGVFADVSGNIYIADAGNNRIQKWVPGATTGITVAGGNGAGLAADQLNFPHGVVVDNNGNIYVADANNNRVQKFTPGNVTGVTVAGGNGSGSAANQLSYATGVCVDASGNVYVNDFSNNRIQKWPVGATTGITVAGGNGAGSANTQLDAPRGLFVDYYSNVYVADQNNHRVQKWAPGSVSGITIAGGYGPGSDSTRLLSPAAVYGENTDKGMIYVVDRLNNRVQLFSFPTTYSYKPELRGVYKASTVFASGCYNWTPVIFIQPAVTTTACPGGRIYFLSRNGGAGNTYQWQVNTGSGFVNITNGTVYSGTNTDSICLNSPPTSWYGNIYRCIVNGNLLSPEYQLKFAVNWQGLYGTDWENVSNWDCGILPDENTDVVIKAHNYPYFFPQISSNVVCRSLILDPDAKLTVKSWGNLDVKKQN